MIAERFRHLTAWLRERSGGILGDSFIYALPSLASAVLGLILTPLVTRRLTLEEYGQVENFNVLVASLGVIAGLNLATATAVLLRSGDSGEESKRVVSSVGALSLLSVVIASMTIGIFGDSLGRFLGWGNWASRLVYLAALSSASASFLGILQTSLRQRFERKKSVVVSLVGPLTYAGLIIVLVGAAGGGLESVLTALVAGAIVSLLLGTVFVRRELDWGSISVQMMGAALKISLPFCIAGWAATVTKSADRFLLMAWASEPLEKVALYAAAEKLLIPIQLVSQGFAVAFPPIAMRLAHSGEAAEGFKKIYIGYVGLSSLLMVVATAASPLVAIALLPRTFHGAIALVPAVSLYLAMAYLFYVFSGGLLATGQTQWLTLASVAAAVLNVSLNAFWIPSFGLMGAIWATNVAITAYALLVGFAAERVYPVGYPRMCLVAYVSAYGLADLSLRGLVWAALAILLQFGLVFMMRILYSPRVGVSAPDAPGGRDGVTPDDVRV
ncbi:MAG: polysaccharide biosynthesis C-terminal domain-containing protein [Fimbriimonadaceae bacterium]|nr:polysaccharide biosynthesis C-terminal domain-containing protein [Fimbriimonadaceae bacterium]